MTNIYIDENLPSQLAHGLDVFQKHLNLKEKHQYKVLSIKDVFGLGAKDEEWIPVLGKEKAVVITQDYNIHRTRHQKELYQSNNIGVIFIKAPKNGMDFWTITKFIITKFEEIKQIIKKYKKPFAFTVGLKSNFQKID